jgi:mRNA interferase MazF
MVSYQPDRGDLIWLDFSPHSGTEQGGRRPALVLSPMRFNVATGLAFVCPITSQVKGGSFEVILKNEQGLSGAVLCDHLRSLDWLSRNASFHAKSNADLFNNVMARLEAVFDFKSLE